MSTLETLQGILSQELKLTAAQLQPEAKLEELGVDSLDLLELLFKIEDSFNLKIMDDMRGSLVTIDDVVRYIDALLTRQPATESHPGDSEPSP